MEGSDEVREIVDKQVVEKRTAGLNFPEIDN